MKENTTESIRKIEELEWTRKLGKRNLEGVGNVTRQGAEARRIRTCMYACSYMYVRMFALVCTYESLRIAMPHICNTGAAEWKAPDKPCRLS